MKRILCLILLCTVLASFATLVACSNEPKTPANISANTTDSTTTTSGEDDYLDSLEQRVNVSDNLPERNFDGADYVIVGEDFREKSYCIDELDEDNSTRVNTEIYNRNIRIEDRFGITFKYVGHSGIDASVVSAAIESSFMSQDDAYDLISYHAVHAGTLASKYCLGNWEDVPYVDFSQPWWSSSNEDILTHSGVCLLAIGDASLSTIESTYCVYFNKRYASDYQFGNLYDTVNSGAWTIDYFNNLIRDVYQDVNNNGADDQDFYGLVTTNGSPVVTFTWAFDNPIFQKNAAGELEYVFKTEKINDIVTKLSNILYGEPGVYCTKELNNMNFYNMFRNSQSIFCLGVFGQSLSWTDWEEDYGMIPYPKWDEAQTDYYSMADGGHAILAYMYGETDVEKVGIITEALCAESWKKVVPAYYDIALKFRGTRDEESIAMLDKIMDSSVYDFGYLFDGWRGVAFHLQNVLVRTNANYESFYKRTSESAIRHYEEVLDAFAYYYEE